MRKSAQHGRHIGVLSGHNLPPPDVSVKERTPKLVGQVMHCVRRRHLRHDALESLGVEHRYRPLNVSEVAASDHPDSAVRPGLILNPAHDLVSVLALVNKRIPLPGAVASASAVL